MGHRLSKIYTRTGDQGETSLGEGTRIGKDHPLIEAMGAIDELNSTIGVVLGHALPKEIASCLERIQHKLFDLGGELCIPGSQVLSAEELEYLEQQLDHFNAALPPLKEFVLPGGGPAAAGCHLARTVCRRAERRLVSLSRTEALQPLLLSYLNRLSDLLFVMARVLSRQGQTQEILWHRDKDDG